MEVTRERGPTLWPVTLTLYTWVFCHYVSWLVLYFGGLRDW